MITVIARDTCKPAYVDEENIKHIEEFSEEIAGRAYPYSTIFVKDPKQKHEYAIDVVESKKRIEALMEAAKMKPLKSDEAADPEIN